MDQSRFDMATRNHYLTLGVARDASEAEIRKAFRSLARRYHPDVSGERDAEARMKEVNAAYAVLSDPGQRAAYDRELAASERRRGGVGGSHGMHFEQRFDAGAGDGFSEFFEQIFGNRHGRAGPRRAAGYASPYEAESVRGRDLQSRVELDLEDAFTGATRQVRLQVPRIDADGRLDVTTRTLEVRIPKGVGAGQRIRLAGQGSPGDGTSPAGDLLLEVAFRPHRRFSVDGRDLRTRLPVAPWEAALGAVIPVDTPGGRLQVRVPAGAQGGTELRVRGRGIPGSPPGDLFLDLQVVVPPADSPEARRAYERLAETLKEGFEAQRQHGARGTA
jgi:curved DNA-binding protein